MRPMSIRTRLVAGLAAGLVVLIAIMLYAVHRQALIEASELVNGDLVSAARIAVQLSGNEPLLVSPAPALLARHAYEPSIVVQFWSRDGVLLTQVGPDAKIGSSPKQSGFPDLTIGERQWCSYSVINHAGTGWVRTLVHADARDLIAADIVWNLAWPALMAVPVLLLLLWAFLSYLLRPLEDFSGILAHTRLNQLTHIDLQPSARELEPMAGAINVLVGRMRSERDIERAFIADAAHELRTPLAGIQLHAQTAQVETDPVRLRRSLANIESGCRRATRMINQLLGLAQYDGVKKLPLMPVRVDGLVREVLEVVLPIADARGVEINSELGADVVVLGNAAALAVMLQNLLANAVQFLPRASVVTLKSLNLGRYVEISVRDCGPGIPKEARRHIFERFARLPGSPTSGSGLGLSIVHRILLLHRGRISVAANEQGGTVFTVSLRSAEVEYCGSVSRLRPR